MMKVGRKNQFYQMKLVDVDNIFLESTSRFVSALHKRFDYGQASVNYWTAEEVKKFTAG